MKHSNMCEAHAAMSNADSIRALSDEKLMSLLAFVFCSGMAAEERGDDFDHSFKWNMAYLKADRNPN